MKSSHAVETAYLAGLIDGEGCLRLQRTGGGQSHSYLSPYVTIGMNDLEPLQHLQSIWGGNIRPHRNSNPRHRDGYLWQVMSQTAVNLLAAVWPFLRVKRIQAWLIFQFWSDRAKLRGQQRISPEEAALREGYKLAIHTANSRGNPLPE